MVLRRKIAERIAPPLKRVGLQTPILKQIPLRAEIISQEELTFPRVLGRIPVIVRGKAYGEVAGRWYRVVFPRAIKDPGVAPVGVARTTTLPRVPIPTIRITPVGKIPAIVSKAVDKIPDVEFPVINITVPRIRWKIPTADDFINGIKQFLGDWGWAFNWIRDAIAWAYGNAQYWGYSTFTKPWQEKMNVVLDNVYTSFDNTRKAINDRIKRINERFETMRTRVNTGFGTLRGNTDTAVETLRKRANSRFETLRGNTESSVNTALGKLFPALYDAWGIPHNIALTPIHVRNVTSTGFEFQSYGKTTCYYIAVGERF